MASVSLRCRGMKILLFTETPFLCYLRISESSVDTGRFSTYVGADAIHRNVAAAAASASALRSLK